MKQEKLHSLIPLEDFKAVISVDDRDDAMSRYCLITATYTIEQYCMRRLLQKKHFENIEITWDFFLPLKEYPVSKVLAFYAIKNSENPRPCGFSDRSFCIAKTPAKAFITPPSMAGELLEPEFYDVVPDCGQYEDFPFALSLSPALKRYPGLAAVKAVYWAGYPSGKVPADLASACLELAAWNMNRYKGRRIGMTGNVRGNGRDGEHFEMSMPCNVRSLLEPYRRRVI